jgi:protein-S-isoprenylcysteine O-methyltransferase Ste14
MSRSSARRASAAGVGATGSAAGARWAGPSPAVPEPATRRAERSPHPRGRRGPLADPADAAARVVTGGLFLGLADRIARDVLRTGRITGLLLLTSELLVVVLTVVRRPARVVDRRWRARLVTALSLLGPPLVGPAGSGALLPDGVTAAASGAGLLVVIAGKLALGRSFGLVPACRGVVTTGPYRVVRHPIYAGYLVTHLAFLVAHPTVWNGLVLAVADLALLVRMHYEERLLTEETAYRAYADRVRWRLAPGLY